MLIKTFNKSRPGLYLLLPFLGLLLWLDAFVLYKQTEVVSLSAAPFYGWMAGWLDSYRLLNVSFAFLFLVVQSFLINFIASRHDLLERTSFLAGLFYLVLMSSSFSLLHLHPALFANFFLILALDKIFKAYGEEEVFLEVFNVGLLIGIATLFYYPSIFFLLVLAYALIIYYVFSLRGIMAALLGFFTPIFFLSLGLYLKGTLTEDVQSTLGEISFFEVFYNPVNAYGLMFLGFIIFLVLITLVPGLGWVQEKAIRVRKRYYVMVFFFIVSVLSLIFSNYHYKSHLALLLVPVSIIAGNRFALFKKRWWPETIFVIMVFIIILGKMVRLE